MNGIFAAGLAVVLIVTSACASLAMEISEIPMPGSEQRMVLVSGAIEPGDAEAFYDFVDGTERATVTLSSLGGLLSEGLSIGAEIRSRGFATMVLADDGCYSACAVMWMSGVRRYMSPTSKIGFHAAYMDTSDGLRESGIANADIGAFLTQMGFNRYTVLFATATGPDDTELLTPDLARALGVDVFLQDGDSFIFPAERPTVPTLAWQFTQLGLVKGNCAEYFGADPALIRTAAEKIHTEGNKIAGPDVWMEYFVLTVDELKQRRKSVYETDMCIEAERSLAEAGIAIGIRGPSFDCAKAQLDAEHGICDHEELWARDRLMAKVYYFLREGDRLQDSEFILQNQRDWLKGRNTCGYEVDCLVRQYDTRIHQLGAVLE